MDAGIVTLLVCVAIIVFAYLFLFVTDCILRKSVRRYLEKMEQVEEAIDGCVKEIDADIEEMNELADTILKKRN